MTEKVFVSGGTGFVGTNLIRLLLRQGYEVKALVRPSSALENLDGLDLEIVQGDLNDPNIWSAMKGCSALFHVAAHMDSHLMTLASVFRHALTMLSN